jgi:hypothetical protein
MAIEVGCFLSNEEAQFSRNFPAGSRPAPAPFEWGVECSGPVFDSWEPAQTRPLFTVPRHPESPANHYFEVF